MLEMDIWRWQSLVQQQIQLFQCFCCKCNCKDLGLRRFWLGPSGLDSVSFGPTLHSALNAFNINRIRPSSRNKANKRRAVGFGWPNLMKLNPAEPYLTKPNLTKPNPTKSNLTKPNLTKPNLTKPNQTFGDITDDTQLNVIGKVKISMIKQPVRALSLSEPPLNVYISNRQS